MCGYFFMGIIDFMLKGKSLLDYVNLLKRFSKKVKMKKIYIALSLTRIENLKTLKYHTFLIKR